MNSGFDVVVVGSCFMDMLWYVPRVPVQGETMHATKFQVDFGGKASNQCVMAAKLGARVAMVAMVGNDRFGHDTIENFKKYGINTDFIKVNDQLSTGVTSIAVDDDGQPTFIGLAGANKAITIDDIKQASNMIRSAPVLVCDKGIPLQIALETLKLGKELGAMTIFNPSPTIEKLSLEDYGYMDLLVINASEGEGLTGIIVDSVETAKEAVKELHKKGTRKVVLTLGEDGAVFLDDNGDQEEIVSHTKANKVNAIDTTGAGDSLLGALAYFLACYPNLPFKEIVQRSISVASFTVTSCGVQSSYPTRDELPPSLFTN
ncbi:ribokinase-like [Actinia tenebrosa]|uniref:Ribokinase n=1 Tax=Actinia tenebrosa TaxID=6105 RepID=A0A6P8IB40_ACTTE|nr:ribokinase-like [Actinia tenebrosa]